MLNHFFFDRACRPMFSTLKSNLLRKKLPALTLVICVVLDICMVRTVCGQQKPVPVKMMSTGNVIHRFFDTSPISPSGKYLALFRFPYNNHSPVPGDQGEVILVDIKTGKESVVAKSAGWEFQLGANVQWGASDEQLFFNDVDTSAWKAFAVCLNPFTGKKREYDNTVFMVAPDGKKFVSYNLVKSTYAQVGYGVVIPARKNHRNIGPVSDDGISVTDVSSGETKRVATIKQIYENSVPSIAIPDPENYEFYCFQVKWNPQGTKILTTIQWAPKKGGDRRRAVITMNADGSDLRTAITPEEWAKGGHHVNWMADGRHLSMNLNVDGNKGLEIITVNYDGTGMKTVYAPGSGHPSFHPGGLPILVTDAYAGEMPAKNGEAPIRLINIKTQKERIVATADLPPIRNFEFRVDAHPAWDRTGRYVVFNGTFNGTRCVFLADLKEVVKEMMK